MNGQFREVALEIDGPEDVEDGRWRAKNESLEQMRRGGIAKESGEEVGRFGNGSGIVLCA